MKSESIWEKPISHGEILKKIWKHLDLATLERDHPFHTPVFGTVCDDAPNLRVVVLRRFWRKSPRLAFHTHIGSPKISEVRSNPNVSFAFYHPQEKLQLRVRGTATVHLNDELAEEQWLSTELFARRCYIGDAPSQESRKPVSGLPEHLLNRQPTAEESEAGRANFVVVSSTIDSIDCLELAVRGHRRSLFVWNASGGLETKWLTP
ncbi:MAG TPA: pyridoxamine 5'-phosphate oxidase family protein [Pyrinomonadaceae bacterium]|jgi:pyridoxine/pyridoxamine 5'-phosphate oxidase